MKIQFFTRSVYGKLRCYLVNESIAEKIAKMTGRSTLSAEDITTLRGLGVEFEQVMDPMAGKTPMATAAANEDQAAA